MCTETRIGCQIAPPITLHLVLGGRPFPKCVTLISTSPTPESPAPSLYISVELGLQVFQMHFNLFCVSRDPNSSSHDCGARTLNHGAIILAPCALFFLCKTGCQQHLTPRLAEVECRIYSWYFYSFLWSYGFFDSHNSRRSVHIAFEVGISLVSTAPLHTWTTHGGPHLSFQHLRDGSRGMSSCGSSWAT